MILFEKDWDRYPSATIHYETTNKSFLSIAKLYRDLGIKNNAFMLALINPALRHVNPHDPDIDVHHAGLVSAECKVNPWYFFREVLRVPPKASLYSAPIMANRGNIIAWWLFFNHITFYLIQVRQTGKSLMAESLTAYLLNIGCDNSIINLFTKDAEQRKKTVLRVKSIIDYLPFYLDLRSKKDSDNKEDITVTAKGNFYYTNIAQPQKDRAINVIRGDTTPILHVDEGPYIKNVEISMPAIAPALSAARDEARKMNTPYGLFFTTTAGKKNEPRGHYMYERVMSAMEVDETKLLDCIDEQDLRTSIRENSNGDVCEVNCTFNHRQLGKTDEWLKEQIEAGTITGEDCLRDYYLVWTAGNERSPISVEDAQVIALNTKDNPLTTTIEHNLYTIDWYIPKDDIDLYMSAHDVIIGLDGSDASGGDDLALVMLDISTLTVIGGGKYNRTNLFKFYEFIATLLIKYPRTTLIPEAKSSLVALINYLLIYLPSKGINPFLRIFNKVVQERDDSEQNKKCFKEIISYGKREDITNKYKKLFGFTTSALGSNAREVLYGQCFRFGIEKCKEKLNYKELTSQILKLVIKNDRIDHDEFSKDDLVIAWLLTLYVVVFGKNLKVYGIIDTPILTTTEKPKNYEQLKQRNDELRQEQLRKNLISLYNQLGQTNDGVGQALIEQKIKRIESQLVLTNVDIETIGQLIKEAKVAKNQRARKEINTGYYIPPVFR